MRAIVVTRRQALLALLAEALVVVGLVLWLTLPGNGSPSRAAPGPTPTAQGSVPTPTAVAPASPAGVLHKLDGCTPDAVQGSTGTVDTRTATCRWPPPRGADGYSLPSSQWARIYTTDTNDTRDRWLTQWYATPRDGKAVVLGNRVLIELSATGPPESCYTGQTTCQFFPWNPTPQKVADQVGGFVAW